MDKIEEVLQKTCNELFGKQVFPIRYVTVLRAALREMAEHSFQEAAKIAQERYERNRLTAAQFAPGDQQAMIDRALANAGEALRIKEAITRQASLYQEGK